MFCVFIMDLWLESNLKSSAGALASPYLFLVSDDVTMGQRILHKQSLDKSCLILMSFNQQATRKSLDSKNLQRHIKDKDICCCWKGKGRVSDIDNDIELPCPDCKVGELMV